MQRVRHYTRPFARLPWLVAIAICVTVPPAYGAEYQGVLQWLGRVELSTPVTGIVGSVSAEPGRRYEKGQPLVQLENKVLQARVEEAKAQVALQERLLQEAGREVERAQELYDRTVLSDHELEVAFIEHAKAKATFESAQATLAKAEFDLFYSVVRAPFDGVVLHSNAEVGQTVVSDLQSHTLVVFASSERMVARADIPASVVSKLKTGASVPVKINGRRYQGTIKHVGLEPVSGRGSDARYSVEVVFDTNGKIFRSGNTAQLDLP